MRLCYLFLLITLLPVPVSAADYQSKARALKTLSLQGALGLAFKSNPEIAVAIREREAVAGTQVQAATRPNPFVSTSIQDTRRDTRQINLQLNQEVELGGKRTARMEAADASYNKADAKLMTKKAELHANVVMAFYKVLVAQEKVALAQSSYAIAESALDAARKRVEAGKSSPVEQAKSSVAASLAKVDLAQSNTELNNSRKQLSALWGSDMPAFESAIGEVTHIPEVGSLVELQALIEHAPEINLAKLEIKTREALTEVERSKATPNITISAGVVKNDELGLNQALFGLSMPIPVFDRNQGNVQSAVSRKYKAEDAFVALKNNMQTKLAMQYERLGAARQTVQLLQIEVLPSAKSVFDAANRGFTLGKFNFIDVLDAQRTLYQAKTQYINALLDAHQSIAEIERILGDVIEHQALNHLKDYES